MSKIDRYIVAQLVRLFGLFGLILVGIYWVNRAVLLFDRLISDGQSARLFLEMTLLSLPTIMLIVLPFAAFASALSVTNRLSGDSELAVLRGAGMSPWRLARPAALFGLGAALALALISHVIAPRAQARLLEREAEIARNQLARLLTPGSFTEGGDGVTVYFGARDSQGRLSDVLISDRRDAERALTIIAQTARLEPGAQSPNLVLAQGMVQQLTRQTDRLSVLRFDELSYDVGTLIPTASGPGYSVRTQSTASLMRAEPALQARTGQSASQLQFMAMARTAQPLLVLIAALLGTTPLLAGGYSRFGLRGQTLAAVGLVLIVLVVDGNVRSAGRAVDVSPWAAFGAVGLGAVLALLPLLAMQIRPSMARAPSGARA